VFFTATLGGKMSDDNGKLVTLHPNPQKKGVSISREKYELIRDEITSALRKDRLTHDELNNRIKSKIKKTFDGSVSWYVETVKLDLEARGKIELDQKRKPAVYTLKK